jgi:hypothetical protein
MPFMERLASRVVGFQPTIIRRNDPVHPRAAFPQDSERRDVPVRTENAPLPVPYSQFSAVGRDAAHATPTVWQYQQLAFSEWLSVMGWPFGVAKTIHALHPSMPLGNALPIRERVNIDSPQPSSLGSLTSLTGVRTTAPEYAKITY